MKPNRLLFLIIFLAASLLLSSCSAITSSSWPGITADQGTIYMAYQTGVFAIKANDGSLIGRYPAKADNAKTFYAPPTLDESQVVVGTYQTQGVLSGLDPKNFSAEKWTFTQAKGRFIGSALSTGTQILAPSEDGNLYSLSPSGQLQWKFAAGGGLWAAPVSDGKVVYQASMDHNIYAVDIASGRQIWKASTGGAMVSAPLLDSGTLYAGTMANEVVALNSGDGKQVWNFATVDAVWTQPVVHENIVYFGDLKGNVYAVDAKTGKKIWSSQIEGSIVNCAGIYSNGVVFGTDMGNLQTFGFKGEKTWAQTISGKLYGKPVVVDNRIILGVVGGTSVIFTYDANGVPGWTFALPK